MRLLLADDHALVRGGLRALVTGLPGVTDVMEAADGHEALAAVAAHRPDVVLMDIAMPRMNGLEATSLILSIAPATRVIIVSMHHDEEHVWDALRAGASGYLAKSAVVEELQEALRAVRRGEVFVSRKLQRAVTREPQRRITLRQREVLSLIAAGLTSRQIGETLRIRVKTVESHRMHLMRRLDIHDIAGLVRYAVRHGLIQAL
ncbi:MAG: response regulator transcription factor [Acidobacteriota bacterium]